MAAQIKKVPLGPLAREDADPALKGTEYESIIPAKEKPGVIFVFPIRAGDDAPVVRRFQLSELSKEVQTRLAVHGLSQKEGDSYAGSGDAPDPWKSAMQSIEEVWTQLRAGDWKTTGTAGPRATMLARALSRVTGRELEECINVVEDMNDEQKKAYRKDARIKKASSELRLEDAAKAAERAKGLPMEDAGTVDLEGLWKQEVEKT